MSGIALIDAERSRQMVVEGWSPEHDNQHRNGELAEAAAAYADLAAYQASTADNPTPLDLRRPMGWPFEAAWWKPSTDPVRNLEKAGALIAAEIDRLQRSSPKPEVRNAH